MLSSDQIALDSIKTSWRTLYSNGKPSDKRKKEKN